MTDPYAAEKMRESKPRKGDTCEAGTVGMSGRAPAVHYCGKPAVVVVGWVALCGDHRELVAEQEARAAEERKTWRRGEP